MNRDSPYGSRLGVNVRALPGFPQDRRAVGALLPSVDVERMIIGRLMLARVVDPTCSVPMYDGTDSCVIDKDGTWGSFYTGAPARRRRSVERYSIVKRA